MKNYIQVFIILMSLGATNQAAAINKLHDNTILKPAQEIIKTHNAIKSASLQIRLGDDLHGFIESKNCSFCKIIRITITPNTKAYANNVNVPLEQAKNRNGQYATIIYNMKTKKVRSIRW